jgi:hypothetical protein
MPKLVLLSVLAHHGEAADPDLLHWIKGVLDHLVVAGPWLAVAVLGLSIVAIPAAVVALYLWQRRRGSPDNRQTTL